MTCRVLVGGIGLPWLRDLDFGTQFVRRVEKLDWPDDVVVDDLSYAAHRVLHTLQDLRPQKVVLVGAMPRDVDAPGTIRRYKLDLTPPEMDEVADRLGEAVTGIIDLDHTLAVVRYWNGFPPDTVVIEIEPSDRAFGLGFSPEIEAQVDTILAMVQEEVAAPVEAPARSGGDNRHGGPHMSDDELPYDEIMSHVGQLVDEIMAYPDPTVGRQVEELLDWVDVFHREGLGRLIDMVRQWRGELFLEDAARDFVIGTFLETYDLGEGRPVDSAAEDAVAAALEEVRPFVESHGGTIVVDSIVDGIVKVQMLGSCDGCPSSTATLTGGVETALREHWPNFRKLEVVDPVAEAEVANGPAAPEAQPVLLQIRGHEGE